MVKIDFVWDRTVEFLREHLGKVLPIALTGLFVPTAILNVLTPVWGVTGQGGRFGLFMITMLLVLAMLWGWLAITLAAIRPDERAGAAMAAVRRLGPMVGVYLILALIFSVLVIPLSLLSVFAGIDPAAMQAGGQLQIASGGAVWGLMLYLLPFLVVTLAALARLMPLAGVVAAERRGVRAISRTWRLTRGMTWRLIAVTILYYVVSSVAGLAAKTVFGTIFGLFGSNDGAVTVPSVLTAIVGAAVSATFTTLAAVFAAKLYVATAETVEFDADRVSIAKPS